MGNSVERKDRGGEESGNGKKANGGSEVVRELVSSLVELHSLQGVLLNQLKKKTE